MTSWKYLYNRNNDDEIINAAIATEEDKRTVISKNDITNVRRITIDAAYPGTDNTKTTLLQRGTNIGQAFITAAQRLLHAKIKCNAQRFSI